MALNALGEIGDCRAAQRLERALKDERNEVRYQAVIAYSRLACPADVVTAVLRATKDDDPAIRYIALRIAEDQRGEEAAAPELVARAKELLEDSAPEVRLVAAIYLAKSGDFSGKALLLDVVRGNVARRPELEDEQEAVELAGTLGMTEAIPSLERRAWGLRRFVQTTCVFQAKVALARMGNARAVAEITKDLASRDREKRHAAIVAAGRARITATRATIQGLGPDEADPDLVREALALLPAE
jgi:HEAT repeat protein